jgi:DNA-binding transcriptional MerR regulator
VVGRTGFYDQSHLSRLRLIGRLQDDGFSLASITRLLSLWEEGRDLGDLVGVERQLDSLLHGRQPILLTVDELVARFPVQAIDADLIQRAAALDIIALTNDGQVRVADERFLNVGAELAGLGIPTQIILDEWEHLTAATDEIAGRWIELFEERLLPADWRTELTPEATARLAQTLDQLQRVAGQVLTAAFDASVARIGGDRLAELVPDELTP